MYIETTDLLIRPIVVDVRQVLETMELLGQLANPCYNCVSLTHKESTCDLYSNHADLSINWWDY